MKIKTYILEQDTLDVLNAHGRRTGHKQPKTAVHELGLWHASAHVWIYDGHGRVLLQRRSHMTWNYPDCWDISSAGHVSTGETGLAAARRELQEELGIAVRPGQLQLLKIVRRAPWDVTYGTRHREYQYIYALQLPKDTKFKLQLLEVSGVRWVALPELLRASTDRVGKRYVPHGTYYRQVYHWLSKLSKTHN